jgi:hypothetical protein
LESSWGRPTWKWRNLIDNSNGDHQEDGARFVISEWRVEQIKTIILGDIDYPSKILLEYLLEKRRISLNNANGVGREKYIKIVIP